MSQLVGTGQKGNSAGTHRKCLKGLRPPESVDEDYLGMGENRGRVDRENLSYEPNRKDSEHLLQPPKLRVRLGDEQNWKEGGKRRSNAAVDLAKEEK